MYKFAGTSEQERDIIEQSNMDTYRTSYIIC